MYCILQRVEYYQGRCTRGVRIQYGMVGKWRQVCLFHVKAMGLGEKAYKPQYATIRGGSCGNADGLGWLTLDIRHALIEAGFHSTLPLLPPRQKDAFLKEDRCY